MFESVTIGAAALFILFSFLWGIHLVYKNAAVVDIGWGIGFIILGGIYLFQDGTTVYLRNLICFGMVLAWGLRITLFLIKRLIKEGHEDKRYQKMREEWKTHLPLKFFFFFQFQVVLELILATPFALISMNLTPGFSIWELLGLIVFLFAIIGEAISDEQLHRFKSNPNNKGKVCDVGFWYYSRHPNYFFEWMVWVGFSIYALGSPLGWIGFLSPALMLFLLLKVSGVPLAEEQSLKSRGDLYRAYQKTTSVFLPLPKRTWSQ